MKAEAELIADQIYDMLDAWHIAITIDQAAEFKTRYPYLANDMVYTYRLSYCALLCKLTDPAMHNGHENLCFESEIDAMKKGARKFQAQGLLAKIRQQSAQYRTVRNKIVAHSSRKVMRSRRVITTPTIRKTTEINNMLSSLYELVFKSVFPWPPAQTPNDLSALLEAAVQQRVSSPTGTQASIDPILESLDALLKVRGYKREAHSFRKLENDLWFMIDVHRAKDSNSRGVDITIDLGVFVPRIEESQIDAAIRSAHWRQRIGALMPEARDVWWFIDSEEKANGAAQQIVRYVERYALPAFREVANLGALEWLWRSGKSPGLTETQRCRNLERLKSLHAS